MLYPTDSCKGSPLTARPMVSAAVKPLSPAIRIGAGKGAVSLGYVRRYMWVEPVDHARQLVPWQPRYENA